MESSIQIKYDLSRRPRKSCPFASAFSAESSSLSRQRSEWIQTGIVNSLYEILKIRSRRIFSAENDFKNLKHLLFLGHKIGDLHEKTFVHENGKTIQHICIEYRTLSELLPNMVYVFLCFFKFFL